jgi:quinol monooxygenase YgiN
MFVRIARGRIAPDQWQAFELAYRQAIHAAGRHDGLLGRWMMRDMAHPDVYYGITHWDGLETLKAYENGVARDIIAALRPFLAEEFVITYCEQRYLWLATSDAPGVAPNDVLGA